MGFAACIKGVSTNRDALEPNWVTNVDEFLKVLVEVGQVVLALLVIRDELLLPSYKLQPLLLEGLPLRSLVANSCNHHGVLIVVSVLGMQGNKAFDGDERELLVSMAGFPLSAHVLCQHPDPSSPQ